MEDEYKWDGFDLNMKIQVFVALLYGGAPPL